MSRMPETIATELTKSAPSAHPRKGFPSVSRELGLAALVLLLPSVLSVMYPVSFRPFFWTTDNFAAILRNLAFEGFLAVGMMLMMVGGAFDLSVGAMASMVG